MSKRRIEQLDFFNWLSIVKNLFVFSRVALDTCDIRFNNIQITIFFQKTPHGLGLQPISGRVDRASAAETINSGSICGRVKAKTIKIGIHSFPAWRSAIIKGQYEASAVCGRQVGRWQLYSKTERSLLCLLAKSTWWIKCNYNYMSFAPRPRL